MKVLMSAYACEPEKGSEPGVGWNWALQAARRHEVWVITRANNRGAIESWAALADTSQLHFIYYDLPKWILWLKPTFFGVRGYYLLWQIGALQVARNHHREIGFDIVHHVTFNAIDSPGFLWTLNAPFIWGPVGGAQIPSPNLKRYFGKHWMLEQIRIARKRSLPWNPLVRLAARNTTHVLAANRDTEALLQRIGVNSISRELETAITAGPLQCRVDPPGTGCFTVLWVGQLSLRKAPGLALDVIEEVGRRHLEVKLLIVGDGPLRASLNASLASRSLGNSVALLGSKPYTEMHRIYEQCDAFLFTSLHDTSGNVLLEAMAHGLPIVTLDHHGAAEIVTPECGYKVPIHTVSQVVSDMATAIGTLAQEPRRARAMGTAGYLRVSSHFSWEHKGDVLTEVYDSVGI